MSWAALGSGLPEGRRIPAAYGFEIEREAWRRAREAFSQPGNKQTVGELVEIFVSRGVEDLRATFGDDLGWDARRRELAQRRLERGTHAHTAEHGRDAQRPGLVARLEKLFARAEPHENPDPQARELERAALGDGLVDEDGGGCNADALEPRRTEA